MLFDMNSTFMFGEDRFSEGEDFYQTYLSSGGSRLSPVEVTRFIRTCYDGMSRDFEDPARYDDFPSLLEGFRFYSNPPEDELPFLERTFALHELGSVPEFSAVILGRLSQTHRLALVANIWAPKQSWLAEFKRAGIEKAFHHTVFSSDFRSIKPSPVLYQEALRGVGARPQEALFIGDSLRYDIEGAKKVGITTVWVTSQPIPHPSVDHVMSTIQELETYAAQHL
ncbi:MAG: HAD family hydrolase [Gammaproteobacteria bacterium]